MGLTNLYNRKTYLKKGCDLLKQKPGELSQNYQSTVKKKKNNK